ncbi:MAG: hypothetical protein V3V09_06790 [Arenicellales bacterium]
MYQYSKAVSIALISSFSIMASAMAASADAPLSATEKMLKMEAECIEKGEEMKAANMPNAEQAIEECLANVATLKADGMKGMVDKAEPEVSEPLIVPAPVPVN